MSHALDLFAGAGGWDLAADALGIHADGVELMPEAVATRDAAGLSTVHDDVWTLDPAAAQGYDGLIASPPCQTFSTAGSGSGRKALDDVLYLLREGAYRDRDLLRSFGAELGDERTALVLSPLHYATAYPFRWLAWEQVPTVLPVWEACAEVLRADGWHVWTGIVSSERYGVPQTRRRAILVASRDRVVTEPAATHSAYYPRDVARRDAGVAPWVSMADAMLDAFGDGWACPERRVFRSSATAKCTVRSVDEPAPTITAGNSTAERCWFPEALVSAGITGEGRPRAVTTPAATVTGKGTAYWLEKGEHYRSLPASAGRRVTIAEAGVLQSFPADYPWQGNKGKRYLQVGNAVPPGLARAVLAEAVGVAAHGREARDLLDLLTA